VTGEHPSPRTGGRILVDQLHRHGVRMAFCVPGESYLAALDALHGSPIRLVVCRHEGGAAYMAEAYGKLTGDPGVCFVTRGPGAANALVALHTAHQDATPLVLFVGLVPRGHRDRFAFQEIDLRATFGSHAKLVETIDDAARIPEHVARAFAAARSGRPGPVVLGLPEDMLTDEVAVADADPIPVPEGAVSDAELVRLHDLLTAAERPIVVAGGGRWTARAVRGLQEWAERWALPVAVDFRCQDLIDNDSPSYVGPLGYGRDDRLAARLRDADLVICVGCPPGDVLTDGFELLTPRPGRTLVQVLPYADVPGLTHRPDLAILASPEAFATAVGDLLPGGPPAWLAETERARAEHLAYRTPVPEGDALDLNAVYGELAAALPEDAIITFGAGNHALWAQRFLPYRAYPAQLAPRNGSMGYGVPAAIAAALLFPERRVISVAGDGCFLMNGQELATAIATGAAPVILVHNNGTYGTIRQHQERTYPGRVSGTDLVNPDFAAYARAFGAHGETVERTADFGPALRRALGSGKAAVIDLRMDPGRLAPGTTVAGLRAARLEEE
jgi:acetolactate synthase-1/2/3 large subunit